MIPALRVDEHIYRGPRPTTAEQFDYLRQTLRIRTILNVEGGFYEEASSDPNWQQVMCVLRGITQVRLAMGPILPPNPILVRSAILVMAEAMEKREPIYVHCHQGVDRTGFVVAAYRMRVYNWTYDRAVAEMRRMGFHFWYRYWLPALRRWEIKR